MASNALAHILEDKLYKFDSRDTNGSRSCVPGEKKAKTNRIESILADSKHIHVALARCAGSGCRDNAKKVEYVMGSH